MVIISTLLPNPEPAIDSTDSVLSMFSLPEMIKQGSFIQLGSYAQGEFSLSSLIL